MVRASDDTLYEVYESTTDYFSAADACEARGGMLASYNTETDKLYVDILCESSIGMMCWVATPKAYGGVCNYVSGSQLLSDGCTKSLFYVCRRESTQ